MRADKVTLILSLVVSFSNLLGKTYVPSSITYVLMLCWIIVALYKFISEKRDRDLLSLCNVFIKGNFYNKVVIYVYTLILILTGLTEKRFFSTNLQTFINGISAIAIVYLFKEKAFKYSVFSLGVAYVIAVCMSILSGTFFFEFHDIAFAAGFLIIYYFSGKEKVVLRDFKWVILGLIIAFVAFKRIAIVALILVLVFGFILNYFEQKSQKTLLNIVNMCMICGIYLFLIVCERGVIGTIAPSIVSGRNYYYSVFGEFAQVAPDFLGLGRNAMATLFATDYAYMRVGNIHSDVLRMFAECGFWVFLYWIINYLVVFPKMIKNKFGFKPMRIYMLCTIYLFFTYLTDNTELYLVTQYFYVLVPMYATLKEMRSQKEGAIVDE